MMARTHSSAFSLLSDFGREKSEFKQPDPEVQLKSAFDDGYQQGLSEGRAEAQADAELLVFDSGGLAEAARFRNRKLAADEEVRVFTGHRDKCRLGQSANDASLFHGPQRGVHTAIVEADTVGVRLNGQ